MQRGGRRVGIVGGRRGEGRGRVRFVGLGKVRGLLRLLLLLAVGLVVAVVERRAREVEVGRWRGCGRRVWRVAIRGMRLVISIGSGNWVVLAVRRRVVCVLVWFLLLLRSGVEEGLIRPS
jgi:hypothetical protein